MKTIVLLLVYVWCVVSLAVLNAPLFTKRLLKIEFKFKGKSYCNWKSME